MISSRLLDLSADSRPGPVKQLRGPAHPAALGCGDEITELINSLPFSHHRRIWS